VWRECRYSPISPRLVLRKAFRYSLGIPGARLIDDLAATTLLAIAPEPSFEDLRITGGCHLRSKANILLDHCSSGLRHEAQAELLPILTQFRPWEDL
jgi:hypothetical protein